MKTAFCVQTWGSVKLPISPLIYAAATRKLWKIAGKKKEKSKRSETSFFGTSSPRPSFWQSMRKSVFSILQTLVGPYSKPLLIKPILRYLVFWYNQSCVIWLFDITNLALFGYLVIWYNQSCVIWFFDITNLGVRWLFIRWNHYLVKVLEIIKIVCLACILHVKQLKTFWLYERGQCHYFK